MCAMSNNPPRASLEEFDLDFTQFGGATFGVDLADIDCQLRAGAVLEGQFAGGTPDHSLADRLKRRAIHAMNDLVADRCVRNRFETQPPARSRVLHLANLRETAVQLGIGLDGLYPAPPVAPEPERDPCLLQCVFGGVQIDASERSCLWRAIGQLQRLHSGPKLARRQFVDEEFQLDLAHVTDLCRLCCSPSPSGIRLQATVPEAHRARGRRANPTALPAFARRPQRLLHRLASRADLCAARPIAVPRVPERPCFDGSMGEPLLSKRSACLTVAVRFVHWRARRLTLPPSEHPHRPKSHPPRRLALPLVDLEPHPPCQAPVEGPGAVLQASGTNVVDRLAKSRIGIGAGQASRTERK